jgi:hypothetical protein
MPVRMNLTQCTLILALVLGIDVTGSTVRAASPMPQDQARDQDYTKSPKYQQGLSEGRDDHAHNRDHSKKRHFKKDDDRKAYEAGYQVGHQGDQPDRH